MEKVKPRKRKIEAMLAMLNDVHGLPQLMADHIRMSFIINYIREHERKDQTTADERSDRAGDTSTETEAGGSSPAPKA
jgi:hypothetical protein